MDYIVVFEYTMVGNGYCGTRFFVPFENEVEFKEKRGEFENNSRMVVACGVSNQEAIRIVQEAPIECWIKSAVEKAFIADKFELFVFRMTIQSLSAIMPDKFKKCIAQEENPLLIVSDEDLIYMLRSGKNAKEILFYCVDKAVDPSTKMLNLGVLITSFSMFLILTGH
jgi:hypothetical protein